MSSVEPLTTPAPSLPPAQQDEAALREAMELHEGVRRLGFMSGIKSNHRNLQVEDEAYARSLAAGDLITPEAATVSKPSDDMDAMAARDITINHNYPAPPMQPITPPVTEPPKQSTLADLAKKAALIAAMGGSGAGGAWLYQYLNKPAAPVIPDVTQPDFNLLPPDPAPGTTK